MKPTRLAIVLGLSLLPVAFSCSGPDESDRESAPRFSMQRPVSDDSDDGRVFAVLINGGGSAEKNYRSHLQHIRRVRRLLLDGGVPDEHIAIFASDGADPAPDLAIIDQVEDDWWLIESSPPGAAFRPKPELINSTVEGAVLQRASREAIGAWFAAVAEILSPGDTVIVYVTDHGRRDPVHLNNNAIVLWDEHLVVDDLIRLLAPVREHARVVMLMSQCFSGAFARAMRPTTEGGAPDGNVCGYFASTADRFAYGCYAENRGRENVGYSFRLLDAVRRSGEFESAHHRVLLTDRTPDVPHRTSDAHLTSLLKLAARSRGVPSDALIDSLLEQAWADDLHYAKLFAEVDAIGRAYGSFSPRTVAELNDRLENLPALSKSLRASARQWDQLARELALENYQAFLAENSDWREVVDLEFLRSLPQTRRASTLMLLIDELRAYALATGASERTTLQKILDYRRMGTEARAASYRMQVRLGAALRIRMLLTRIAGLVYLDRHAQSEDRRAHEALERCEQFELPSRPPRPNGKDDVEPYPPLADEMALLAAVLPGWLGVEYRAADASMRVEFDLLGGAVVVTRVHEFSPAADAGLVVGDVILGPPGEHFRRRAELREWVTTSFVDEVRPLDLLRDAVPRRVEIRTGSLPDA